MNSIKDKLKVGQILTYKQICLVVDEKEKSGKSKQLQLREWLRYFDFEKLKTKFNIKEIYDIPKPKVDKRQQANTNNNKYGIFVQMLLLDLLVKNHGIINDTFSSLALSLSMINVNFKNFENNIPRLEEIIKVDSYYIYEFYFNCSCSLSLTALCSDSLSVNFAH